MNDMTTTIDRRQMLNCLAGGFGSVGLAAMLGESAAADATASKPSLPHHAPRAKRVIFLFMNGGPSQIDTFDPKPELARWAMPFPPLGSSPNMGNPAWM